MQINTDGLIIREQSIGESDRLVTVLTREQGILRAFVRGAKAMKSRSASSTQLLCYSRLSIYEGREKYIIDEAEPIEVFFSLRTDFEKLSLAQYFCELALALAPEGLPCHRVVNSQGRTAPGWTGQRELLAAEGVHFRANGCVDLSASGWEEIG